MRVLCCWTDLRPDTQAALEHHSAAQGHELELVDCRRGDTRYHEQLERYWQAGADWVNVEHDLVIDERVLPAFEACAEPWCVFVYELACGYTPGALGCVRFRAELMAALPDAMRLAGLADTSGVVAKAWYRTDVRLDLYLRHAGYRPHVHGRIQHLNPVSKLADPDRAYLEFLEKQLPVHA